MDADDIDMNTDVAPYVNMDKMIFVEFVEMAHRMRFEMILVLILYGQICSRLE